MDAGIVVCDCHLSPVSYAIPPLIAFIAINLKRDRRSSWHYMKRDAFNALRSRLIYQQRETPLADHIASISRDLGEVNARMQKEFDEHLAFDWNAVRGENRQTAPRSNVSSAVPSLGPPVLQECSPGEVSYIGSNEPD